MRLPCVDTFGAWRNGGARALGARGCGFESAAPTRNRNLLAGRGFAGGSEPVSAQGGSGPSTTGARPAGSSASDLVRDVLIVLLAVAMGMQNAAARRLAVPDLTTTVLTLTITGMAADGRLGAGGDSRLERRTLAVFAMFGGALIGAALVLAAGGTVTLLVALGVAGEIAVVPSVRRAATDATTRRADRGEGTTDRR